MVKIRVFVGTSGWQYRSWNPDSSLKWYAEKSGLNAIELNFSFYKFPSAKAVKDWAKQSRKLRWVIKVNRVITHTYKFNERAWKQWLRFKKLFAPLDKKIDFYLFQLPPILTPNQADRIAKFAKKTKLGKRFALEVRNEKWFDKKWISWARKNKITWVSIDAPEFSRDVFNTTGIVYERIHGRSGWYSHNYSTAELKEIARKIKAAKPKKVYVFFNNNHAMLKNAQEMARILK